MGLNITQKILKSHLVESECSEEGRSLVPGAEMAVHIDQVLTQDATGTMAFLQFEALGLDRVQCDLAVSYVDHNTVQVGPENADDHAYLRTAAARYGAVFSPPGNGICHQVHLERFGVPGKTLLGCDSHTPTGGGLGMLAIGVGGLDAAVAMGGKPCFMPVPEVIKIELKGRLKPWVSAKDIILKILEMFSTKGNVGSVFEYDGPGLKNLEIPERATIANMGAECGVTTSVFPSDDVTKTFLQAQGREDAWGPLAADADADYARVVTIDLSTLEPMAAAPHSPGNVSSIAMLAGKKVDQVLIGSCTNASYRDLKMVARIVAGKQVAPGVDAGIAAGSRQVLRMLSREGLLTTLLDAGFRLLDTACGFCIGNSMAPATEAVSLRTSNRNFEGRSGTPSAQVYLVSPEMAAIAALAGRIMDPSLKGEDCPTVRQPKEFLVDDSLLVLPPEGKKPRVIKGPGIGKVPLCRPLPKALKGEVVIKVGDLVTTDHIMPAGQRLRFRSNVEMYSTFVFENVDADFAKRAAANRDAGTHNVIVAGDSYGQGSSREHAALCPRFLGVRAVIAKSIERIHRSNLVNFGIVPFVFARKGDYDLVAQGAGVTIADLQDVVAASGKAAARIGETEISLKLDLSPRERAIVLAGGLLNTVKS